MDGVGSIMKVVIISKGPLKIMENRVKSITKDFSLALTHDLEIFQFA